MSVPQVRWHGGEESLLTQLTLVLGGEVAQPAARPAEAVPGTAPVLLRRARPADVRVLVELMRDYTKQGLLLPRTAEQIARDIDQYTLAVDSQGIVGCVALRPFTPVLAELCALAVDGRAQGRGVGGMLVESVVEEASRAGFEQLFALTLRESFFNRLGFRTGLIADVPEKVWADCAGCPVRAACREIMVVRDLTSAR